MKQWMKVILCSAALTTVSATVSAKDPFEDEIKARQGYYQVIKFNFGLLGAMVKGKKEYDSALADSAAKNILAMSKLDNSLFWPKGSDNSQLDNTRAKPGIWENFPDVKEKSGNWKAAVEKLASEAGNGKDALKASFGPVGKACKACHDEYKAK